MNYPEIKKEVENKQTILFKECKLFWAFSNEQFVQNKTELQEGEKYVSIGGGGYMPKSSVEIFTKGMKEIEAWKKAEVKKNKDGQEEQILYELNNHEAFYTQDIEDTYQALGKQYTRKEIWKVFYKNKENYAN